MKLNLKFYKGKDEYSDGDIEDRIIEFIKKYPDNYEKVMTMQNYYGALRKCRKGVMWKGKPQKYCQIITTYF